MIKIYDKNRSFIQGTEDYKDIKIEEEINLTSTLAFSIPLNSKDLFEEEGYVEVKGEGSFVIKEVNTNIESISIVCKQDLEVLASQSFNKAYITKTMQFILNDLLNGTGWTGIADTRISRTVTGTNMSVLDYIYKAIDIFKYEVKFDSVNKKVIAKEKIGSDKGVYFHDEVNLKSTNVSSDTYDFVTRIIPIGFDGLGIELINNGKSYVENHSYSNKIITIEWKDERYTVVENLKRDAELKLEKLCKPLRTYSCTIEDLSKSKDYTTLSYEVGDVIDLIDREKGIREQQRIMKTVKYLNSEGEDTVEIANRPRIFGDNLEDKIDDINSNISSTNSRLELLDDKIIAEVETINQSVMDNVKTINTKIGQLIITDSEISNMVSDLTTTIDGNKTETDSKIGKLEITSESISARVSRTETKISGAETNISNAYTLINQTADEVSIVASNKVGKNEVISSINLSPELAKIKAKNIELAGAVTVLDELSSNLGTMRVGRLLSNNIDIDLNYDDVRIKAGALRLTNNNGQVVIDGSSNMFKIHTVIDLSLNAGTDLKYTYTASHGLGYVPAFLGFQVDTPNSLTGNTHLPAFGVGGEDESFGISSVIRATVDSNYLKIEYKRKTNAGITGRFKVRVFILKEAII